METFSRDSLYLATQLDLPIQIDYVRRAGRAGRVAGDTALRYFQQLDINTRRRLFNIYKYDFILFGYDWEQYFR